MSACQLTALVAALGMPAAAAVVPQAPPELATELPAAALQGSVEMRFLGLRICDIRLWTAGGALPADWSSAPLALEITYARSLDGRRIAERSLKEMQRQAEIDPAQGERWLDTMKRLFPDVHEGDRITGVQHPGAGARFFVDGRFRGEVADPQFARLFFGIWLSPRSSEPALRAALIGGAR